LRLLLDTCTFLWITLDAPELSQRARELFVEPANDVYLSTVSAWEIALKVSIGRLSIPWGRGSFIRTQREQHGIDSLPLDEETALHLPRLPDLHKDPFDRMLVCQALCHGLVILTPDDLILRYSVRTEW
jgi:PIN domain nuclease of toxin-antitoxin system